MFHSRSKLGVGFTQDVIPVHSSQAVIKSVIKPTSEAAASHARNVIDQDAAMISAGYLRSTWTQLKEAEASHAVAADRLELIRGRAVRARKRLVRGGRGSWPRAILSVAAAVVCFAAEFAVSWETLPFLLNIRRSSFLGISTGLAPPTALLVLEVVVARLIERPWREMKAGSKSRLSRRFTSLMMAAFLSAVGAANLYTIVVLASARGEGITVRQALERLDDVDPSVNRELIEKAMVAVSFVLALDGAILLLLGFSQVRRLSARCEVANLRWRQLKLQSKKSDAAATLEVGRQAWQEAEKDASARAARFREQRLLELEQALRPPEERRSSLDVVNELLARSPRIRSRVEVG